jgi:hypothetical protein
LGPLDEPAGVGKGILTGALLVAEHAGNEAADGIHDDHRRHFPSGEDEVADGELFGPQSRADAGVEALVSATDEDDPLPTGELLDHFLGKPTPPGGEQDHRGCSSPSLHTDIGTNCGLEAISDDMLGTGDHGAGHEEHPWATPEGAVIDLPVYSLGEVADVRHPDIEEARGAGGPEQTSVEEAGEHLGKKGEDVDAHDERLVPA